MEDKNKISDEEIVSSNDTSQSEAENSDQNIFEPTELERMIYLINYKYKE